MFSKTYISCPEKEGFTEPIIVSGNYVGIRLLSVYDFVICIKMYNELMKNRIFNGIDGKIYSSICEQACIASLCTYDSNGKKIFSEAMHALKNLTPYELSLIYTEYGKLQDKIAHRDKISKKILEKAKNYHSRKTH